MRKRQTPRTSSTGLEPKVKGKLGIDVLPRLNVRCHDAWMHDYHDVSIVYTNTKTGNVIKENKKMD